MHQHTLKAQQAALKELKIHGVVMDFAFAPLSLGKYAPGCGGPTHVVGTNAGTMPCGAFLTQQGVRAQYFCPLCEDGV